MHNPNKKRVSIEGNNTTCIALTTQGLLNTVCQRQANGYFWLQRVQQMVPL